jgi:hypothetical protein
MGRRNIIMTNEIFWHLTGAIDRAEADLLATNLYVQLDAVKNICVLRIDNRGHLCLRNFRITRRIIDRAKICLERCPLRQK